MKKKKPFKLNFSHADVPGFSKAKFGLTDFPWPIKDESIEEISCLMQLQYVPGKDRGKVMDEMYRVLVKGGTTRIAVPYWSSKRSVQDYMTESPAIVEDSFLYFNKGWRELNHPDRKLKCDFSFDASCVSYQLPAEIHGRSDEVRSDMILHNNNTVLDMIVVLTKK